MQVSKEHYEFSSYVNKERWISYYYQLKEVIETRPRKVLIIGRGDNIVPKILQEIFSNENIKMRSLSENCPCEIKTFDYDNSLIPDYLGDIRDIDKIIDSKYDCILCCQVLEHLEWCFFEEIIQKIRLICDGSLILSLPRRNVSFRVKIDLPKIHYKGIIHFPRFWEGKFLFNGEHYWEVDTNICTHKTLCEIVSKYFVIKNEYLVFENPYHWFLILNSKGDITSNEAI